MKPGDRVCYSARFLRSIGCYTGETAFRRGTLVALGEPFATVQWDDDGETMCVRLDNLAVVGSLKACDAYVG